MVLSVNYFISTYLEDPSCDRCNNSKVLNHCNNQNKASMKMCDLLRMALAADFKKKSIVIISGASRGIGSAIAKNFAKELDPNSAFLLLARSEEGLIKTKDEIQEISSNFNVKYNVVDFSKPDTKLYESLVENFIKSVDITEVSFAYCFHNAGHIGTMKKAVSLTDLEAWRSYFDLNIFSTVLLNSVFVNKFRPIAKQVIIVNITSLAGRNPLMNLAMYGSGKASRDIYFKVLAVEEPDCWLLNYSPGPVDTDMFNSIVTEAESPEVRETFKVVKEKVLTPDQTVKKMMHVLGKGLYKSGDVIDYYDV